MNVSEAVQEGLKALVLPELKAMAAEIAAVRLEQARQAGQLDAINHRLSDMHRTLVLNTQRHDGLTRKDDELRKDMEARFQEQRRESDARFDRLHGRIDALIQVMVKPEEFGTLRRRVDRVEGRVRHLRRASGQ